MAKNKEITVLSETVRVQQINREDFICLTDIAKFKNAEDPRFVIQNWMRTQAFSRISRSLGSVEQSRF